jgi:hypothetical protein
MLAKLLSTPDMSNATSLEGSISISFRAFLFAKDKSDRLHYVFQDLNPS